MAKAAAVRLGLGHDAPVAPRRRSLLRLRGRIVYWHLKNGKPGTWGVLKSDALTKYHCHLSEFRNTNRAPEIGQMVEFSPRLRRRVYETTKP